MSNQLRALRSFFMTLLASAALATVGCGHQVAPMQVRFADIDKGALKGYTGAQPLVVEFQSGERIPLDFELRGESFELDPQHPPLEIAVKQHCFLRIGSDGFRISQDPAHFDDKPKAPGTFRIGFGARAGQRAKATVVIEGPRH